MLNILIGYEKTYLKKTTLKCNSCGEPSSIDMARILQLLANKEPTQRVLACDPEKKSSEILFDFNDHR